jgi:hypothetical protein
MLTKFLPKKLFLNQANAMLFLRVLIILITLVVAFFVKTGVVSADPGWGVVGG